ncbi:MAG: hypothetical protein WEC37_00205, partial [Anaerolineales bacterium]
YETRFRFPYLIQLSVDEAGRTALELSGDVSFAGPRGAGLQIEFAEIVHPITIELGLSGGDNFDLVYLDVDENVLGSQRLISDMEASIEMYDIDVPIAISSIGVAAVRVLPIRIGLELADAEYLFSYLRWSE